MVQKVITITAISLLVLLCIIYSIISLVNYDSIGQKFAKHLGVDTVGVIQVIKFPVPYIKIQSIKKDHEVELEQIRAHLSLPSFLTFSPKINKLDISNIKFYSDGQDVHPLEYSGVIDYFLKYNLQDIDLNIKNLNIVNKQNSLLTRFTECATTRSTFSRDVVFKANNDTIGLIAGTLKQDDKFLYLNVNIDNDYYNLIIKETYKAHKLEHGTGGLRVKNLSHDLMSVLSGIFPNFDKNPNFFKQNESLNIKFDILNTVDFVKLANVSVNSSVATGSGEINLSKHDALPSMIELKFSKIDINTTSNRDTTKNLHSPSTNLRFMIPNALLETNIKIDKLILGNTESLNEVSFTLSRTNDIIKVKEFSGVMQSGGNFNIIGDITHNSVRSMFKGHITLQNTDLNSFLNILGLNSVTTAKPVYCSLSSDIKSTSMDIYLNNFSLSTETSNITGNISTKMIASVPHINAELNISSLDLDKQEYPFISSAINFAENLTRSMKDIDYLSKFIAVRTINYFANFYINVSNLNYNNNQLSKVNLLANISPGIIRIENLDVIKDKDYLSSSWNLNASNVKPYLLIEIKDGVLSNNWLSPAFLLNLRDKLVNNYSLDKILLKLHGQLSKIHQNDFTLENIKLSIENDGNLFKIGNFEADVLSGKFQGTGNISLTPYTIDFVYALNSINLSELSLSLPKVLPTLNGFASFNGKFSTSGYSLKDQLYNLTTNSSFIINNVVADNFSIDLFVKKINMPNYDSRKLDEDLRAAINTGKSNISNIVGTVDLQKGIVLLKDLKLSSEYSTSVASAAINIYNFDVNSSAISTFYIRTANSDKDNILINLPLTIQGSIVDLRKSFDSTEIKKVFNTRQLNKKHD